MSGKFAAMKAQRQAAAPPKERAEEQVAVVAGPAKARIGKKAVSGYFSPDVSRGLNMLAIEQGTTLQALMGEAFDDLMRKYGKHPFGER